MMISVPTFSLFLFNLKMCSLILLFRNHPQSGKNFARPILGNLILYFLLFKALYRKLVDPSIRWSARLPTLLKLVYQSILADTNAERKAAFAQRLLTVALSHPNPGFVAGSLILIEKVRLEGNVDVIGCLTQVSI